jgi:hypothetical protein
MNRPVHADLRRLHWIELIVHGRSRARQIKNLIDLDEQRKADVVAHQLEARVREQTMYIVSRPSVKIIHTQNFVAALQYRLHSELKIRAAGDARRSVIMPSPPGGQPPVSREVWGSGDV